MTATDEALAARFFDAEVARTYGRVPDDISAEHLGKARRRYIRDATANPEAMAQLREWTSGEPIVVCLTDSDACTCGAPVTTPAGMHHEDCPTNPASRMTAEQREWIGRRDGESLDDYNDRIRAGNGLPPIKARQGTA